MALTDSMFLFEIKVEKLTSFINCREFCIRGQFADVFSINLKDPNESGTYIRSRTYKVKRKTRLRTVKASDKSPAAEVQAGQSVLVANNVDNLISNMTQYPMELSLWSKLVPDYKIGSTHIQWNETFLEYLKANHEKQNSVCVEGDYSVFDESTSKRMAVVKLTVKLTYMKEKTSMHSIVKEEPVTLVEDSCDSKAFYCTEKRRVGSFNENKSRIMNKEVKWKDYYDSSSKERVSEFETNEEGNIKIECKRFHSDNVNVVRSYTKADINVIKTKSCSSINKKMYDYIFGGRPAGPFGSQVYCVSYFTVEKDFADSPKSENTEKSASDKSKTASEKSKTVSDKSKSVSSRSKSPSEKSHTISENSKSDGALDEEKYKFRICKSDCPRKLAGNVSGTRSFCSLDLPLKATELITVKKCGRLDCGHRIMRRLPTPPDNRILLDLSSRRRDCCDATEKVEEVIGGMTAKLKFGSEPCYCECECQFGFIKKTTFCDICGGYEVFGDEYAKTPGYELPFPCPIFHKLADKNRLLKLSTSGSDTKRDKKEVSEPKKKEALEPKKEKKEAVEQKRDKKEPAETKKEKKDPKQKGAEKVIESEKDTTKKGKHKKKDDRFKFNYGYSAPHIGHSRCMLPCAGTMTVVPKTMGWLWNAENIAGVKMSKVGWKPGAISKRLLRKLNKAKRQTHPVKKVKLTKKTKKRVEDKPTLIISKKNGEYRVEMQASPEDSEVNLDQCSPVVYRISREDNDERIRKRLRKQRRLTKDAVDKIWVDPYHPEVCEKTCLRAYKQAIGIYDPNNPECICSEEEEEAECSCSSEDDDDSSDSSLDLEWEIHFTPPIAFQA